MAVSIQMDLRGDHGENLNTVRQIIEKRKKELGYTTGQTCVAMAINILKSIRGDTRVANEKEEPTLTITDVSDQYYPSWLTKGAGKKNRTRVLRAGKNGNVVQPKFVTWLCQHYYPGQVVYTFQVVDTIGDGKKYQYLIVADDQQTAVDVATSRHKKRIIRAKSLAKFALGWAMHLVHDVQNPNDTVSDSIRKTGLTNVHAEVNETGFGDGDVSIHVEDALNYATDALKNENVDVAIQKALNKMVGFINHKLHQKGIYDDLKIPAKRIEEQT